MKTYEESPRDSKTKNQDPPKDDDRDDWSTGW